MSAERKKILQMLAEGKITAEEAEQLLERLGPSDETASAGQQSGRRRKPKWLHVAVDSPRKGDRVNIKVPLTIIRAGMKFATVLPPGAEEKLSAKGIDLSRLSELTGEELDEVLRELTIDVDSGDGDVVKIFCE
jgi:hypothetical protein